MLAEQAKVEPVARVAGYYGGRCVIEPTFNALLPSGIALYLHPAPVPKGMVLVPREPTEKMLEAGARTFDYGGLAEAEYCWKVMLAAAEKP